MKYIPGIPPSQEVSELDEDFARLPGPLLLLAGPGTGKTHWLAKRAKYLVEESGLPPESLTVVTFTNEAADNMVARISDPTKAELYIDPDRRPRSIRTLHGLAFRLIQDHAEEIGFAHEPKLLPSLTATARVVMEDAAQLLGFPRGTSEAVIDCRQHGKCEMRDADPRCQVCRQYRTILGKCSRVDFDEQILLACQALRDNPRILREERAKCRHLLVDEYQDMNAAQFELIGLLSAGQLDGLFVVGDDDQSIYSWRGGTPRYIRQFEKDFGPEATMRNLTTSRRCHRNILEGALSVVRAYDKERSLKPDYEYAKKEGPLIHLVSSPTHIREAAEISDIFRRSPNQDGLILVPSRAYVEPIAQALDRAGIAHSSPPVVPGEGLPLIDTIGDCIGDPDDSMNLRLFIEILYEHAQADRLPQRKSRKAGGEEIRDKRLLAVAELWKAVVGEDISLREALERAASGGLGDLAQIHDCLESLLAESNDAGTFLSALLGKVKVWSSRDSLLTEIRKWLKLSEPSSGLTTKRKIKIATFQGAKGLEAPIVCVVGAEEGVIPKKVSDAERLVEEARLFYVCMTRASEHLYVFSARKRPASITFLDSYGDGKRGPIRSQFVKSIPRKYAEEVYIPK